MFSRLSMALLAATTLTIPALADEVSAYRLFIADHTEPRVSALDPASGETIAQFDLTSPARLYAAASGEAVIAVQANTNQVAAIASGIVVDDHGDHGDIEVSAPRLVDAVVEGDRPVHFVEHGSKIALFFDGAGTTSILDTHAWIDDGKAEVKEIDSGAPHHGVAIPWGSHTIITVPHPEDPSKLPIGVNVLDADGNRVGETHGCADLHGEAASGNLLLIACADGILVVSGSGAPKIEKIDYAGLPEGKSTTLVGGQGLQYFLGNYGADKVVLIDPTEAEPYRLVDLPTRRVHFVTDPVRSKFAYIFTEDGQLRQLDVIKGEITASVAVTEPYSMDGEWSLPRPRLAVAGDVIAVTDPLAGKVHLVDAASFAVTNAIAVEGLPYNIVAVGGSGSVH